jgi:predicted secreted Zn-dependent protease
VVQGVHAVPKTVVVVAAAAAAAAATAVVVAVVWIGVEGTAPTTLVLAGLDRRAPAVHTSELYVVMNYTEEWERPVVVEGYCTTNFQQQSGFVVEVAGADADADAEAAEQR